MADITNGYKRSLTIKITKKIDNEIQSGYPKTYDGKESFVWNNIVWPIITKDDLIEMFSSEFQNRFIAFKAYIESKEFGMSSSLLSYDDAAIYNITECPDETITTTTTTTTTSTTTTTTTTCLDCTTTTTTTTSSTTTTTTTKQTVLWAVAGYSLLKSDDYGQTWQTKYTHTNYLRSITFLNENVGIAVGATDSGSKYNGVLKTTNGGETWSDTGYYLPDAAIGRYFYSATKELNNAVYIGGNMSTFIKYDLASDSWYNVSKGTSHNAYDMYAFDSNEIISITSLGAANDYILKTKNSGSSWYEPSTSPQDRTLTGVDFYGNTGIVISSANATLNKLFKSTDKGETWSVLSTLIFGYNAMQAISMPTENYVYIVGDDQAATEGKVWRSINSGDGWANLSSNLPANTPPLRSVRFLNDKEGWVGADAGKIYHTDDWGNSWTEYQAISENYEISDIFIMQI